MGLISLNLTTDPTKCGLNNGSASVTLGSPTVGAVTYQWYILIKGSYVLIPGATTNSITNLAPGNYQLIVTDSDTPVPNTGQVEFTITSSTALTLTSSVTQPTCWQYCDGKITITPSGGGGGYTYLWNTGATTATISNLCPKSTYSVTVTSSQNCTATASFTLSSQCTDDCDNFTLEQLKIATFKIQCCAAALGKKYVQYQNAGRADLAQCILTDLKYLTVALEPLLCIEEVPDPRLTCDDIQKILNYTAKICDCDCCNPAGTKTYTATYNPFTGTVNTGTLIN